MRDRGISVAAGRIKLKADAANKERCSKERDEAYATMGKNQEEYDKQLLTLSAGFLAFSLAFIKDIVHTDQAIFRGLLYASFAVLGFCVALVLASFQISIVGLEKAKLHWESKGDGDGSVKFPYGYATFVKYLNWLTGIIFVIGVGMTITFVIINLRNEGIVNNQPKIAQDGALIKTPSQGDKLEKGQNLKRPSTQTPRPAITPSNTTKK